MVLNVVSTYGVQVGSATPKTKISVFPVYGHNVCRPVQEHPDADYQGQIKTMGSWSDS